MEQTTGLPVLSGWQNFYMIFGTAAATLTGLMFVATSLAAGIVRNTETLDAGISAFNTPTVVHFGAVLLTAGILSAPWSALSSIQLVLGLLALALVIYMLIVMRRMRSVPNYHAPLKDWLWYLVYPLAAYVALLAAAMLLPASPQPAHYIIAAVMVVVLCIGIHNAWDLVTYFATIRDHSEHRGRR